MNRLLCMSLACLLIFSACRSRKKKARVVPVKLDTSAAFLKADDQEKLERYKFDYKYLSLAGSIQIKQGNDSKKASIHIRMLKDSLIWIRISAGVEVSRILINKDSMIMLDRLNTQYYVYPVSYTETMYGMYLTLDDIQRVLVGNLVFNQMNYARLDSNAGNIRIGWENGKYKSESSFNTILYRPLSTSVAGKTVYKSTLITFSNFDELNGQNLARKIVIEGTFKNEPSKVEIEYTSANTEPIAEFPFSIPSTYDKKN